MQNSFISRRIGATAATLAVIIVAGFSWTAHSTPAEADGPRRIKALFLGDRGHHEPLQRARQFYSVMGQRGIDITYTENVADLNPKTLGRYDCLIVYANITTIKPAEEQALLDFVASGKGFVPIHCASYCFLNSPAITALTGGRFKSHGTGVFKETIVQPDHPIMKGLTAIESWDETYVHEMHNEKDRTVLADRVDGDHREPYTWVRTHGKGRVFYTAWGHDQRTWGHVGFQDLIERGVRWASGDWAMQGPLTLKPFEYAPAKLPFYPAGMQWGTSETTQRPMQQPVVADESMRHMVVPPGFDVRLFASDPEIKKPICMAWDERGRLWVAETFDYPNNIQGEGNGHDRIVICEDTNGDGIADKFTVFADKLSIPTSIVFANGGLIVAQVPHMLFLKDTDGDDKADVRKILFSGWGTSDTHAVVSNMRWGFDNWIYGVVGYSGFNGMVGGQRVSFGQGLLRFKPDGSKLEFLGSTTNNTWGLGLSEDGNIFASTANNHPSFFLHIPNRYYEQVRGFPAKRLENIADTQHIYPITDKVRQVDQHGSYTAGAGHALYTARSFPKEYWNRVAFVAEPTGHVLGKFILERNGSAFTSRNDFSMLASDDEWTSPITAEVGPDGSLWMIDWYNYIIQHNPIPRGFVQGKGNAYETPLRDKEHGRVYRIRHEDAKAYEPIYLHNATPTRLVQTLSNDNMFWRLTAQRLLVDRGNSDVVPELIKLTADTSVDGIGLNPGAIHALWTMQGLNALDGSNTQAAAAAGQTLHHPSAAVRKTAVAVLPRTAESIDAILSAKLLEDSDLEVRKCTLLSLSEMPPSDLVGAAIFQILSRKENANDRWITDAAIIAAARHDAGFLKAAFAAYENKETPQPIKVAQSNLISNPSIEDGQDGKPRGWQIRHYSGRATHDWVTGGRTGEHSLRIQSDRGADSSWFADVKVEPDTDYRLTGWIKTEGVERTGAGLGALFNVHLIGVRTRAINGTNDWQKVEVTFNSGDQTMVGINALFGGFGQSKGTAWFDDVELVRAQSAGLPGTVGKVVAAVTNHYAQRGPTESAAATLASLRRTNPLLASVVVASLAAGWPEGKAPQLSDADIAELHAVMKALPADSRDGMIALADRWGQRQIFAEEIAGVIRDLRTALADKKLESQKRLDASRRLILVDDSREAIDLVLKQINPTAPPEVQMGLLDALSTSRNSAAGQAIVARWTALSPMVQTGAVNLMLRKAAWTSALLDGVEAGAINPRDLRPQHWQVLTSQRDRQLADRAQKLEKSAGRSPNADKQKLFESLKPLADKKGDASIGKQVFVKNCAVCHTLEGEGGKVGPELTGIGARARADILLEIIDPNRSVEGTYRQWMVETKDEVLFGRLMGESKTSVEIIDAAGKLHEVPRQEIRKLFASDRSVMPEGFEQLPGQEITSLLEFLAQSTVKH